jgi:hypothetical protein
VATIAAIMADYPLEIIKHVTDPRTGIAANPPGDWTGMPNPADVKRALEERRRYLERVAEGERWQARLAASKAVERLPAPRKEHIEG